MELCTFVENNVVRSRVTDELKQFGKATGILRRTNDEPEELVSTNVGKGNGKDANLDSTYREKYVRWNDVRRIIPANE